MSDVPTFLAFCDGGLFSDEQRPGFTNPDAAVPLSAGASILTTSTMLQLDGWYAVPGDVSASFEPNQNDCQPLGKGGAICKSAHGTVYESAVTRRSYTLKYRGKGSQPVAVADLLNQLDGLMPVVPVLFDGAYNCTFEGAAGNLMGVGADGSIDTSCLSVLPIYLSKGQACPQGAKEVGGKCPFGHEGGG